MEQITGAELAGLTARQLEDEHTPQLVAEWAEANAGKPLRSDRLPERPAGLEPFRLYRVAGMVELVTPSYLRKQGREGVSFLLAYCDTHARSQWGGAKVPTVEELRTRNRAQYEGREERNAARRELLRCPALLERLAGAVESWRRAQVELAAAVQGFELALEAAGCPDGYELRRLYELRGLEEAGR